MTASFTGAVVKLDKNKFKRTGIGFNALKKNVFTVKIGGK